MKEEDVRVFEKAFSELSGEGFFRDFAAKAGHLRENGTAAGIQRAARHESGYGDYTEEKYRQPGFAVGENDVLFETGAADKNAE